jgi:uncharacterized membrane protein (UPF0127 family)
VTLPGGTALTAETARSPQERLAALRDRTGIDPEGAVLLAYPEPGELKFSAETLRTPVDLVFLDAKGRITSAQPYTVDTDVLGDGSYILALNAGSIEQLNLKKGQRVRLGAAMAAHDEDDKEKPEKGRDDGLDQDEMNREMLESLGNLKGKVPDAMYEQMMGQAAQAGAMLKADPNADTLDVLKTVTGMDYKKLMSRTEELKRKNPKMTDDEVARQVAAEMIKDLPMPKPGANPPKP